MPNYLNFYMPLLCQNITSTTLLCTSDLSEIMNCPEIVPTTWGLCQGTWLVTSRPSTTCTEQWRVQKVHSLNLSYLGYLCCVVDRCAASMRFHVKLLWYFWLIMGSRCYRLPSVTWMRHLCCPGLHWRPHRGLTMTPTYCDAYSQSPRRLKKKCLLNSLWSIIIIMKGK